jgi:hypothetical protein
MRDFESCQRSSPAKAVRKSETDRCARKADGQEAVFDLLFLCRQRNKTTYMEIKRYLPWCGGRSCEGEGGGSMRRRDFFKSSVAVAGALTLQSESALGLVPAHNWGKYDFGSGPAVADRLNQGPFPQYPPDAVIPSDDVVMATTPSEEAVPNYGKGLVGS